MKADRAAPRRYSLAHLTAAPLDPPDAVALAAELGYQAVGLRALPATPGGHCSALISNPDLLRETRARLAATGVVVFDMEIVRIGAPFDVGAMTPFLDVCAALGARAVLVAADDPDESRLTHSFAAFAAAAAPYGLTADLEFMPWTTVNCCAVARRVVERAGAPNGRVLVDSLHAARSATTIDDLAALPRALISYIQLCDAPAGVPTRLDDMLHTARHARLLPGDGGIDLAAMAAALPEDVPVSIELPNDSAKHERGVRDWARRALHATRRLLEGPEV